MKKFNYYECTNGDERKARGWARTWKRAEVEHMNSGDAAEELQASICRAAREENEWVLVHRFKYTPEQLEELYAMV